MKALDDSGLLYLWGKIKAIFVRDVQIENTSVVSSGTANIPYGTTSVRGVVKVTQGNGLTISESGSSKGTISMSKASTTAPGAVLPSTDLSYVASSGALSVDATATPTASKVAKFDANAKINSTDMSSADIADFITGLGGLGTLIFNAVYPVGSYYETSDSSFNPNTSFGGTWELEAEGLVHIGSGTNYTIGATGGEATHKLTSSESGMPSHRHLDCAGGYNVHDAGSWATRTAPANQTGSTPFINNQTYTSYESANASSAHNNMQPYVVVNRWHRTA